MNENLDDLVLTEEDIDWVLNDDPMDVDNQLLGDDTEVDTINLDNNFIERLDDTLDAVKETGEWIIDRLFTMTVK